MPKGVGRGREAVYQRMTLREHAEKVAQAVLTTLGLEFAMMKVHDGHVPAATLTAEPGTVFDCFAQ